jgi:hypothetical protein
LKQNEPLSWIREARAQELCGIGRPTWKSWARIGLIEEDAGGTYDERDVLAIAIVASLREHLTPHQTRTARRVLQHDRRWEDLVEHARALGTNDRFDLVIEPQTCGVRLATDDPTLVRAVRFPSDPRLVLVVSLAGRLRRIRDGFRSIAVTSERPRQRRPGRPAVVPRAPAPKSS